MGWEQKDAVGEPLKKGDHVKVFRNFGEDEGCADFVGKVSVVGGLEFPHYSGKYHVRVCFSGGFGIWVHHMSVMKV